MGLSGARKRVKYSDDPNNLHWARSKTVGRRLLEAQGWNEGECLGANGHRKASFKQPSAFNHASFGNRENNLGLGARKAKFDDLSLATGLHGFQDLLSRLNGKSQEDLSQVQSARSMIAKQRFLERKGVVLFVQGGTLDKQVKTTPDLERKDRRLCETVSPSEEASTQKTQISDTSRQCDAPHPTHDASGKKRNPKPSKLDKKFANDASELAHKIERIGHETGAPSNANEQDSSVLDASIDNSHPSPCQTQCPIVGDVESTPRRSKKEKKKKNKKALKNESVNSQSIGEATQAESKMGIPRATPIPHKPTNDSANEVAQPLSADDAKAMVEVPSQLQLSRGNLVRRKFIDQKRRAIGNAQAMNEIFMHRKIA